MDMPTNPVWIIVLLDEALKYGGGVKFRGYVETQAEPFCVEFFF
jgi:hypothetical protein